MKKEAVKNIIHAVAITTGFILSVTAVRSTSRLISEVESLEARLSLIEEDSPNIAIKELTSITNGLVNDMTEIHSNIIKLRSDISDEIYSLRVRVSLLERPAEAKIRKPRQKTIPDPLVTATTKPDPKTSTPVIKAVDDPNEDDPS